MWFRKRPPFEMTSRERVDEAVAVLNAAARAKPGEVVKMPDWFNEHHHAAFRELLPIVREGVQNERYRLQADGIYLTSN